jgi:ELWxxDGT repeat protein
MSQHAVQLPSKLCPQGFTDTTARASGLKTKFRPALIDLAVAAVGGFVLLKVLLSHQRRKPERGGCQRIEIAIPILLVLFHFRQGGARLFEGETRVIPHALCSRLLTFGACSGLVSAMDFRTSFRLALVLGGVTVSVDAQQPHEFVRLVQDFNLTPVNGNPSSLMVFNNLLYFSATDGTHGIELWQTDGTNVTRLTDLSYGSVNSFISSITEFNGQLYFRGSGTTNGNLDLELWTYDGTTASQVSNIRPNSGGSNPSNLKVYNGVLYFAANDGMSGTELWAYDGSSVYQAADINPGAGSSNPTGLTVYGGLLCFAASNNINGTEFYTFDGFNLSIADINPGAANSNPAGFTEFNGVLYFQATEPTGGAELWAFNGSTVYQVADIRPGTSGSSPASFVVYNGALYFAANDGVNGSELWQYDGVNPPSRVTQIAPGSASSSPANPVVFNNVLYFAATDGSSGVELWQYDGTSASRVADINPGSASSSPAGLRVYNGALYFAATDAATGRQLWRYDGSSVSRFAVINSGSAGSSFGPNAIFNGYYYMTVTGTNTAFYKYDGSNFTVVSTTRYPENAGDLVVYKGALHFSNPAGSIVDQIWRYDGTNFTSLGGVFPGNFGELVEYKGILYFPGEESSHGRELWKCDGTNVSFAVDIYPGANGSSPYGLKVFNGFLYFYASDASGLGLWKYDGTNASRVSGMIPYGLGGLLEFNGNLYFGAGTTNSDFEPCKFDGTNLTKLAEINVFNTNAMVVFWNVFRNQAYFSAWDGINGSQLWRTDGTDVSRVTGLAGTTGVYAFPFFDTLYFMGNNGVTDYELWKYDGANVSQVADINPGAAGSMPTPHRAYNNAYYFEANDGLHGIELWRLDPLSALVRITGITRQGKDVSLTWTMPGGFTHALQSAPPGPGGISSSNFTDRSPTLVSPAGSIVTMNYLDVGGGTNAAKYYRIRLP